MNKFRLIQNGYRFFPILCVLFVIISFIITSYIDYLEYINYNLNVFDLGQTFSLAYQYSIPNFTNNASETRKLIYLLYVPIVKLFPSPFSIVIIENSLFSLTAFFLYLTSVNLGISRKRGFLIAFFFLFNYALLGPIFDPGHYQYLFSIFFILGFYLISKHHTILAVCFYFLSALTSDLALVTIIIFSLMWIISDIKFKSHPFFNYNDLNYPHRIRYAFFLLISTFIILSISIYYFGGMSSFILGGHVFLTSSLSVNTSGPTLFGDISSNLTLKMLFVVFMLLPYFLYIPFSKYSILLIPYFLLLFFSNFVYYGYFQFSYPSNIIILLFIIVIDVERKHSTHIKLKNISPINIKIKFGKKFKRKFIALVLIIIALNLMALPYSPVNESLPKAFLNSTDTPFYNNFNLIEQISHSQYDTYISSLISMIPLNTTVLVERNMPQLTNRVGWEDPGLYNGTPIIDYTLVDPYLGKEDS